MPSSGRDMLDRAALVHRWDCPAVAAEPALEADARQAAISGRVLSDFKGLGRHFRLAV